MPSTEMNNRDQLKEIALGIDEEVASNPGASMAVDPDVAEHMGAFEENAITMEEALDSAFDSEFEPDDFGGDV